MRLLYTALLYLLTPFVLLRLWWRGRALPAYRERWGERFGHVPRPNTNVAVWVHAVSVGETLAAVPYIRRLVDQYGPGRVLVTTTTPTGSERVLSALQGQVLHTYAPYDLPHVVRRFLNRMRPQQVVVMETELWPNLFHALRQRDIPLIVANARLSPRSFRGYARVRGFAAQTLQQCQEVAAQSEADAQRFRALGAPCVSVMGNIKFDLDIPLDQCELGRVWRERLGPERPVWIAASTHEGEEAQVLAAQAEVLAAMPSAVLILVPRHPQRFEAVARLIAHSGMPWERRSAEREDLAQVSVLLGDSMGEMFAYFSAADVAFIGGSLVPVGGHNLLEPAALSLPVLTGPHLHNFIAARDLLLHAAAARVVVDAQRLAREVIALLGDPATRKRMGSAGRTAVGANRGALERLLRLTEAVREDARERGQ